MDAPVMPTAWLFQGNDYMSAAGCPAAGRLPLFPVPPAPVLPRAVRNSGGTDKMMGNAPKTASPRLRLKKLIAITVFNFLQQYIYVFFIVEKTTLI